MVKFGVLLSPSQKRGNYLCVRSETSRLESAPACDCADAVRFDVFCGSGSGDRDGRSSMPFPASCRCVDDRVSCVVSSRFFRRMAVERICLSVSLFSERYGARKFAHGGGMARRFACVFNLFSLRESGTVVRSALSVDRVFPVAVLDDDLLYGRRYF